VRGKRELMAKTKVLIVEDDARIAALLKSYLEADGFLAPIMTESDKVASQVRLSPPHLILLDIMLPGKDGLAVFREIKSFSDIPIIFITARAQEVDRLLGFELGADDYVCKPFTPREVVARVKAVLRRAYPEPVEETFTVGPIYLDSARHVVRINSADVHLTPIQFELLKCLMTQPGVVFTRNDLILKIQGYNFDGYNRTIDTHIKNLRRKLKPYFPEQEVLRSIYGIGYSFMIQETEGPFP